MTRLHHSRSSEIAHIVTEAKKMTASELMTSYGVEIKPDGTVYDTITDTTFKTLNAWATIVVEEEQDSSYTDDYDDYKSSFDDEDEFK
jgi:tyrosine-protein phosphatase YwqE